MLASISAAYDRQLLQGGGGSTAGSTERQGGASSSIAQQETQVCGCISYPAELTHDTAATLYAFQRLTKPGMEGSDVW